MLLVLTASAGSAKARNRGSGHSGHNRFDLASASVCGQQAIGEIC